jgi:hypothetical protein
MIVFRPIPGSSTERIQRIVDCHLAQNVALGVRPPDPMDYCPLAVRSARAVTRAEPDGIAVTVWSADPEAAAEIRRRAKTLLSRSTRSANEGREHEGP